MGITWRALYFKDIMSNSECVDSKGDVRISEGKIASRGGQSSHALRARELCLADSCTLAKGGLCSRR